MHRLSPFCLALPLALVAHGARAQVPTQAPTQAIDLPEIPACTALLPGAVSVDTTPVNLDVRVLLDGVGQAEAEGLFRTAQQAYSAWQITLRASYERVAFGGSDATGLIQQAKARFGGQRPRGSDLVYVLTTKDLTDPTVGNSVAGQADCIGGVADPTRAFAVGEVRPINTPTNLIVYSLFTHFAAKTIAHELGHLMGAHHHYANCAESALPGDAPCTLMTNIVDVQKLQFSTLNGSVVRGHAQLHARP